MEIGPDKEIDPDNGNRSEYYGNRSGQWKSIRTVGNRSEQWKSIRTVGNRSEQLEIGPNSVNSMHALDRVCRMHDAWLAVWCTILSLSPYHAISQCGHFDGSITRHDPS